MFKAPTRQRSLFDQPPTQPTWLPEQEARLIEYLVGLLLSVVKPARASDEQDHQ